MFPPSYGGNPNSLLDRILLFFERIVDAIYAFFGLE